MNFKQLNEVYELYTKDNLKYAKIDAEKLFKEIVPQEFHFISEEEVKKVREFLKIEEVESEEELRAIRNSIVAYGTKNIEVLRKQSDELSKKWHEENPTGTYAEFMKQNPYDIIWDQISAFTQVIDMELQKRFSHV